MRKAILIALLIAVPIAPSLVVTAASECPKVLASTIHISGDYHYATTRNDFFKEDNGWPGIQVGPCARADVGLIPADICVSGANCRGADPNGLPSGPEEIS